MPFSTLIGKQKLGPVEHYGLISFVLNFFKKYFKDVVHPTGYNRNTNRAVTDLAAILILGCAGYRLNLAAREIINSHDELLKNKQVDEKVEKLTTSRTASVKYTSCCKNL